jgi:hypothetical protein
MTWPQTPSTVIPAKAGIQVRQGVMDPGSSLRYGRDDDLMSVRDFFRTLLVLLSHKTQHDVFSYTSATKCSIQAHLHPDRGTGMDRGSSEESEARFAAYVEALGAVLGHADRQQPMHDYCLGLLMPIERKSVEPMAAVTAPAQVAAKHLRGQQRLCHPLEAPPTAADGSPILDP